MYPAKLRADCVLVNSRLSCLYPRTNLFPFSFLGISSISLSFGLLYRHQLVNSSQNQNEILTVFDKVYSGIFNQTQNNLSYNYPLKNPKEEKYIPNNI